LLHHIADDDARDRFVEIARNANESMLQLEPMSAAKQQVVGRLRDIAGAELAQEIELGLIEPEFQRIAAAVRPSADALSIDQNGLGYNNLLYTAATVSTLQHDDSLAFRALLIEEPEAHLHPQLQQLLFRFLKRVATSNPPVQVVMTSHSPTFASQAELDSLLVLHGAGNTPFCAHIAELALEDTAKTKLHRFLDVTRSQLFFARRVILVEGLSEQLIIPALARRLKLDLTSSAVSIISTHGLNFKPFVQLYVAEGGLSTRCAVITDADPEANVYPELDEDREMSATASQLAALQTHNARVFVGQKTLEYDLALHRENLPVLVAAYKKLHPRLGEALERDLAHCVQHPPSQGARVFYEFVCVARQLAKPEFAQALSDILLTTDQPFTIPPYIESALHHVAPQPEVAHTANPEPAHEVTRK